MRPPSISLCVSSASRVSSVSRFTCAVIGSLLFVSLSNAALAQRGGGMGGGRGGGMGGGRGGGGRGGSAESPTKRIKSEFDASDPVQFLLKRDKPLKLEKTQKDSLKSLHKDLDAAEKPIFSDVEKVFADAEKNAQQARDDGDNPAPAGAGAAGGRGARRMPDGVRELVAKLTDTQSAFNDRARAQLNDGQRHIADSLKTIYDAELRDKEAKQRPQSGGMGGRRGR
jgi:hypothetical protein